MTKKISADTAFTSQQQNKTKKKNLTLHHVSCKDSMTGYVNHEAGEC